jgi:hypothetical protein
MFAEVHRSSQNIRWTDHRGDKVLRCEGLDELNTVSLCLALAVASRVLRVLTMAVTVTVTVAMVAVLPCARWTEGRRDSFLDDVGCCELPIVVVKIMGFSGKL